MIFRYLTPKFYSDYPSVDYPEMMLKENRPYAQVIVEVLGLKFAVPLRSGFSHNTDILWTDKTRKHGLDFTKAILILDDEYIDKDTVVHINDYEYKKLLGKEKYIQEKMLKCILHYAKAKRNVDNTQHDKVYCSYSTLQYFESYIFKA